MRIGVVYGDGYDAGVRPEDLLADDRASVIVGSTDAVLADEPSLVVALGESALLSLVRTGITIPILPVDAGRGVGAVPADALPDALDAVLDEEWTPTRLRSLAVSVDDERIATAFMDVMLVTAEPARISEYRVTTPVRPVAQFRADGVVVASPQGSHGYSHRLDGPLLAPETDALAVIPIAPFAIDHDQWILDAEDGVTLTVERDEGHVSLFVDDRRVRSISPGDVVDVTAGDGVIIATTEESMSTFAVD